MRSDCINGRNGPRRRKKCSTGYEYLPERRYNEIKGID
jgi:hypothetical protein